MVDKYKCVWDFDSPVFAAASIGDIRYIEAHHNKSGRIKEFKNVTEFYGKGKAVGGWLGEQKGDWEKTDFTIINCTKRNPVISIDKMKKSIISQIKMVEEKDFCEELRLVIGGKGNYRNDIYDDYKANRRKTPKPTQLQPLREWLASEYDVIQKDGIEADDVLGIWAKWGYNRALKSGDYKDNNICSVFIDKDILQFPGWYYNPKKNHLIPTWQTEIEASRCFWEQMLIGDRSDNIPGLDDLTDEVRKGHGIKGVRGVGKTRATFLLEDCKNPLDMEEKVLYLYESYYDQFEESCWKEEFQLNYQLLKLQDQKGVIPKYEFKV